MSENKLPGANSLSLRMRKFIPLSFFTLLGPGLVATAAGNDAGGIATYAVAGASFGLKFLWLIIPITIALYIVQEMSARLGAATGKGFSDLIRENFDLRTTVFMMVLLFVANAAVVVSNFAGMAAAFELFGISKYISIPIITSVIWWLIVKGTYNKVEKVFIAMSGILLSYVIAAFFAKPDWSAVTRSIFVPSFSTQPTYLALLVAFVGTTIAPYMQMYAQSAVVERGITMKDYRTEKIDTFVGVFFSNVVALFIIIATAFTLFPRGISIESAADAALALSPLAGKFAEVLFGLGLLGASLLASSVISLTTAFSVCNAFGWESGVNRSLEEAPIFYALFTILIVMSATITLTPSISLIKLLLNLQVLNGILLPFELIFMMKLINKHELMGKHTNGKIYNLFAWATTIGVGVAALLYIVSTALAYFNRE